MSSRSLLSRMKGTLTKKNKQTLTKPIDANIIAAGTNTHIFPDDVGGETYTYGGEIMYSGETNYMYENSVSKMESPLEIMETLTFSRASMCDNGNTPSLSQHIPTYEIKPQNETKPQNEMKSSGKMKHISLSKNKLNGKSSPNNTTLTKPVEVVVTPVESIPVWEKSEDKPVERMEKRDSINDHITTPSFISPQNEIKSITSPPATVSFVTSPGKYPEYDVTAHIASPTVSARSSPTVSVFSSPASSSPPSPTETTPNTEDIFQFKSDPHEIWYEPRSMSDITLYVQLVDETGQLTGTNITIHSHKQVLSIASIYFRTIFEKDHDLEEFTMPTSFVYTKIHNNAGGSISVNSNEVRTLFDLFYRTKTLSSVLSADPTMDMHLALLVMIHEIHEATQVQAEIETDMCQRIAKFPTNNSREASRLLHLLLVAQHLHLTRVAIAAGQTLCSAMGQPAVHQLVVSDPLLDLVQSCHLRSALCATSASRVLTSELGSLSQELSQLTAELNGWRAQHLPLIDPKSVSTMSTVAARETVLLFNKLKQLTIVAEQMKEKMAKHR